MRSEMWAALLVAATVGVPGALEAQYAEKWGVPGSPTGEAVALVLEMIDRGDADFVRSSLGERFSTSFVESHPMEAHLGIFAQMHGDLPGVRPGGVMRVPGGAQFTAASGDGARSLTITLEVDDEGRITNMNVEG